MFAINCHLINISQSLRSKNMFLVFRRNLTGWIGGNFQLKNFAISLTSEVIVPINSALGIAKLEQNSISRLRSVAHLNVTINHGDYHFAVCFFTSKTISLRTGFIFYPVEMFRLSDNYGGSDDILLAFWFSFRPYFKELIFDVLGFWIQAFWSFFERFDNF